jgi:FdhD protein
LLEVRLARYHHGESLPTDDIVARESPLRINLNGKTLVRLMRMPGDEAELAAGFCLTEGLLSGRDEITGISRTSGGRSLPLWTPAEGKKEETGDTVEEVDVSAAVDGVEPGRFGFDVIRTGAGGGGFEDLERSVDFIAGSDVRFTPRVIEAAPGLLVEGQEVFRLTGATHGAGVFDRGGKMLVVSEDVGRHNAVDKALGHLLLAGVGIKDKGLILSGRVSFEMVIKGARAGVPLLCSVSAPTTLGVEAGGKAGVTLVGFLRGGSFNVYSHPERIGIS